MVRLVLMPTSRDFFFVYSVIQSINNLSSFQHLLEIFQLSKYDHHTVQRAVMKET